MNARFTRHKKSSLACGVVLLLSRQLVSAQALPDSSSRRNTSTLLPMPPQYAAAAVQSWTPLPSLFGSNLVFAVSAKAHSGKENTFLVTKRIGEGPLVNQEFKSYLSSSIQESSGVTFSPDGRYIVVASGHLVDLSDILVLYLWDLQNPQAQVAQGPLEYAYSPKVIWSPDSRSFVFYAGTIEGEFGGSRALNFLPMIYNIQTQKSREVPISGLFWTRRNTRLTLGRYQPRSPKKDASDTFITQRNHTSLYEVSLQGGKPQLVVQNARAPYAESPDGRWIAFQGWAEPTPAERAAIEKVPVENQLYSPEVSALDKLAFYLYDQVEKKRYRVAGSEEFGHVLLEHFALSDLHWTPDGKNILIVRGDLLYKVEMPNRTLSLLMEEPLNPGKNDSSGIEILGFAQESSLVVALRTVGQLTSIHTIKVADGEVSTLAIIQNAQGVTWSKPEKPLKRD